MKKIAAVFILSILFKLLITMNIKKKNITMSRSIILIATWFTIYIFYITLQAMTPSRLHGPPPFWLAYSICSEYSFYQNGVILAYPWWSKPPAVSSACRQGTDRLISGNIAPDRRPVVKLRSGVSRHISLSVLAQGNPKPMAGFILPSADEPKAPNHAWLWQRPRVAQP